jgi:hypothetical protein
MHDVVSDILASTDVPRNRKRATILRAAERYRDDTTFLMTEQEWRDMATAMGVENMGGPAVGFLLPLPEGTVPRGAVMAAGAHAGHDRTSASSASTDTIAAMHHVMVETPPDSVIITSAQELLTGLLEDSAIRQRILADTMLHRMVLELIERLPAEHRGPLRAMLHGGDSPAFQPPAGRRRDGVEVS